MNEIKNIAVILAAAGEASRLSNGKIKSKQSVCLAEKPLLFYSLDKFCSIKEISEIVIVSNDVEQTKSLLEKYKCPANISFKVVLGGKLRQESVRIGFCEITTLPKLVIIHDVARPFFKIEHLKQCIDLAFQMGASALAIPLSETLKEVRYDKDKLNVIKTIDRNKLYLSQTPQVISYNLLFEVYENYTKNKGQNTIFTDEASILESMSKPVSVVESDRLNIKITYPEDLKIAEAILHIHEEKSIL